MPPETTSRRQTLRAPSGGTAPPATAELPGGEVLHLTVLAHEISDRLHEEFPDERETYGRAGFAWCVHDNQWILSWAALDVGSARAILADNLRWLTRVLAARSYPVERLARDLEIAADVVADGSEDRTRLAETLRAGAGVIRGEAAT